MINQEYLGSGLKFPISVNPATGRTELSSGNMSVKEAIYLILSTNRGERLARPYFGTNLDFYTFMDVNATNLNIMVRDLTETIMQQEPRIESLNIIPEPDLDHGRLIINIEYMVSGEHNPDSLVYPFYLNVQEEEPEEEPAEFQSVDFEE